MKIKSRMFPFGIACLSLVVLCMTGLPSSSHAEVLYRNNFGNDIETNMAMNHINVGWSLLRAEHGGNIVDQSSIGDARSGIRDTEGRPSNLPNVNAPLSLSNTYGVAFLSNAAGAPRYHGLFFTNHYTVDRSNWHIDSFEWYANRSNSSDGSAQRLAVQIGGNWYVADAMTPVTGSFNNFSGPNSILFSIDPDTANWYGLTVTIGSPFAIGDTIVPLPDGDITGFGLYVDAGTVASAFSRFDTFTINATAIPEPGAIGLIGLGVLFALCAYRKTKR